MLSKKNLYRILAFSFIVGLLWPASWQPWYQKKSVAASYENLNTPNEVFFEYHQKVNNTFNQALNLLHGKNLNKQELEAFEDYTDSCQDSTSTHCLAMLLNEELFAAQTRLSELEKNYISPAALLTDTANDTRASQLALEEDSIRMADALDLSLEVYDSFRFIYPIHIQLVGEKDRETTSLRAELEDNIRGLERLRRLFEYYPHAFQDVTSLSCQ